jgi:putative NADH-flavin reductase
LTAADGKSWISFEDFGVVLGDEIERRAHIRKRFYRRLNKAAGLSPSRAG